MALILRLVRQTLLPPGPTGPRNPRRLGALLLFVPLFLLLQLLHWLGFLLDEILFPGYRKVAIREPLFVVGLPRSGTSYLQRVLAQDGERFTTLRLWELLLAPSVTERRLWQGVQALDRVLGRPVSRLLAWGAGRGFRWMEAVHEVSLSEPEEDFFLLLPVFACFLLVVPFPYHGEIWKLARFDDLSREERDPIMAFYRRALQRHLYVVGPERQLLSKNPSFTPFLRSLVETFPDGRFLCCVRDPVTVVPSLLSSVQSGADLFGYAVAEPRIRDRFVEMLEHFAHHAQATLDGLPEDRYAFVPMEALKRDVKGFVLGVYRRFGWEADPSFAEGLEEEASRGKAYASKHRYTLGDYGLSADEVSARFSELNWRFGWGGRKDAVSDPGEGGPLPATRSGPGDGPGKEPA